MYVCLRACLELGVSAVSCVPARPQSDTTDFTRMLWRGAAQVAPHSTAPGPEEVSKRRPHPSLGACKLQVIRDCVGHRKPNAAEEQRHLAMYIPLYQVFLMGISGLELGTSETFTFQNRQMD